MKVRAVLKKAGRTVMAMAIVAAVCLTMTVPAFAKNYKLEDKGINYREYLSFIIGDNEYTMSQLSGEGVDLSGVDKSTPVYARVDIDGLNAAMKDAGSEFTYALDAKQTYMSRHIESNVTVLYRFQPNTDGTYAIISEDDGANLTLENLAYVQTVGLYIYNTTSTSSAYYGMDALIANLFKINVIGKFPAKAAVTYVDTAGNELYKFDYVSEELGYWGDSTTVEYSTFPEIGNSFELAGYPPYATSAGVSFGYEGRELEVTVNKLAPNFDKLGEILEEVENLEEKNYTEESMQTLLDAVEQAQAVVEKGDAAYQYEVDAAVSAVRAAIDGLQESVVTVDKTTLKDALDKFDGYNSKDYTEESWAAYKAAYDAAMNVFNDKNATQEQVDNALTALNNAANGLKKAGTTDNTSGAADQTNGKTSGAPVTGDNSYAQVYAAVAVMSLAAAAVVLAKRKKYN